MMKYIKIKGFFTGSRVYGILHPESDIDLVIHCNSEQFEMFKLLGGKMVCSSNLNVKLRNDNNTVLNLIVIKDKPLAKAWLRGTKKCLKYVSTGGSLLTRTFAIRIIESYIARYRI